MSRRRPGTVRRHAALLSDEVEAAAELARALHAAQASVVAPLAAYEAAVTARQAHVIDRRSYAAELEAAAEKTEGALLRAASLVLVAERLARLSSSLLDAVIGFAGCLAIKAREAGASLEAPPGAPELTREALLEDARARVNACDPSMN